MQAALSLSVAALLGGPSTPYPNGVYDAASAQVYFGRRPLAVAGRALEIGFRASSFAGALLSDTLSGDGMNGPRADERGQALTNLLVELGPAFIKIGQSASVRTDLLPPAYVRALTSLQEDVPAFSSAEAREIIVAELGHSGAAKALVAGLSAEPIAAASLGQVYRGTLDGAPVAVKVQRPSITERIALVRDCFRSYLLVRAVAPCSLASSLEDAHTVFLTCLTPTLPWRAMMAGYALGSGGCCTTRVAAGSPWRPRGGR